MFHCLGNVVDLARHRPEQFLNLRTGVQVEHAEAEAVERLLAYLQGVVPAFEQRLLSEAVPYLIQLARQLMVGVAHLFIVVPHGQLGGFERFYYQY